MSDLRARQWIHQDATTNSPAKEAATKCINRRPLSFSPSRAAVRAFLRQQKGYGHAEAFLQQRYPSRFNAFGSLVWQGSVYDGMHVALRREGVPALFAPKVYQGRFCGAGFQSVYQPFLTWWFQIFATAEWQVAAVCAGLAGISAAWTEHLAPGVALIAIAGIMTLLTLGAGMLAGAHAVKSKKWKGGHRIRGFLLVALLNIVQPLSRAAGRAAGVWQSRKWGHTFPSSKRLYGNLWTREQWLDHMQVHLKAAGWMVMPSNEWHTTDLEIRGPGPCKAWLSSVYEDDVAHATHYVRYRVTARRKAVPAMIGLTLLATCGTSIFFMPGLAPLALPVVVYLTMLWRAKKQMVSAVSQMAMECGKPLGMTPAQDDFQAGTP